MEKNRNKQLLTFFKFIREGNSQNFKQLQSSRAALLRSSAIADIFRKAYDNRSKVAFRSVIMPTEIFFAMDIIPFCVEMNSALFAASNMAAHFLNTAEQNHYSRDICSFTRAAIGAAHDNCLPTPDLLAHTTYFCDSTSKLFCILADIYKKDAFILDIPYYNDAESISYLANQIQDLTRSIEESLNIKLDPEKLKQAIDYSNKSREYFIKLNELRKNIPSPLAGCEAIDYAINISHLLGSKEMLKICKTLYEENQQKLNAHKKEVIQRKPRVLWHHLRTFFNNEIMEYIENKKNIEIVYENINHIDWDAMDTDDPYTSLAKKTMAIAHSTRVPDDQDKVMMKEKMDKIINDYNIDGVVSLNHWGCRWILSIHQIYRDQLAKRNIPLLELDGDCLDGRNYSFEQIKTRIDAFSEMLHERIK